MKSQSNQALHRQNVQQNKGLNDGKDNLLAAATVPYNYSYKPQTAITNHWAQRLVQPSHKIAEFFYLAVCRQN